MSSPPDVLGHFTRLAPPASSNPEVFSAVRLDTGSSVRVAKSGSGHPALLLPASGQQHAPIALRNLRVLFDIACRTEMDGAVSDEILTVVECLSDDSNIRELFLRAVADVLIACESDLSLGTVSGAIDALVELFRELAEPSSRSVQGMWGELFLLSECRDPLTAVQSWHVLPDDRFDFGTRDLRVEVKTTTQDRVHEFGLDQLDARAARVVVASVVTQRLGGGVSVPDLSEAVQRRLSGHPDEQLRVLQTVVRVLGEDWGAAQDLRLDPGLASRSLRFFDAESVPSVSRPLPDGVSHVSFRAELDDSAALTTRDVLTSDSLWAYLPG